MRAAQSNLASHVLCSQWLLSPRLHLFHYGIRLNDNDGTQKIQWDCQHIQNFMTIVVCVCRPQVDDGYFPQLLSTLYF